MIYILYAILGMVLYFIKIGLLQSFLILLIVLAIDITTVLVIDITTRIKANYYD
jgi:hypothetical protein